MRQAGFCSCVPRLSVAVGNDASFLAIVFRPLLAFPSQRHAIVIHEAAQADCLSPQAWHIPLGTLQRGVRFEQQFSVHDQVGKLQATGLCLVQQVACPVAIDPVDKVDPQGLAAPVAFMLGIALAGAVAETADGGVALDQDGDMGIEQGQGELGAVGMSLELFEAAAPVAGAAGFLLVVGLVEQALDLCIVQQTVRLLQQPGQVWIGAGRDSLVQFQRAQ